MLIPVLYRLQNLIIFLDGEVNKRHISKQSPSWLPHFQILTQVGHHLLRHRLSDRRYRRKNIHTERYRSERQEGEYFSRRQIARKPCWMTDSQVPGGGNEFTRIFPV